MSKTTESLQRLSALEWENNRTRRVDALAESLTHLRAAIAAMPPGGRAAIGEVQRDLSNRAESIRMLLTIELNDVNPFER